MSFSPYLLDYDMINLLLNNLNYEYKNPHLLNKINVDLL